MFFLNVSGISRPNSLLLYIRLYIYLVILIFFYDCLQIDLPGSRNHKEPAAPVYLLTGSSYLSAQLKADVCLACSRLSVDLCDDTGLESAG